MSKKRNKNKTEVIESPVVEIENFDENELLREFGAIQEDVEIFEPASDEEATVLEADSSLTEGTELEGYESSEIVEQEFIEDERVESIIESVLFSTDKAVTVGAIKQIFVGTNIKTDRIRKAIDKLSIDYASGRRGVTLEEINGGYQLRTKMDNVEYLRRLHKERPFKLSGPALEVLSICAYKQPLIKSEVDQIRGVESGHLMRALMDRRLIQFAGKSELPGKPMLYGTTRLFLETFGLRNINELPSLSEIDELIPEGITPESAEKKETLGDLSSEMGLAQGHSYSESEEELSKITEKLQEIDTTTEFFEEEKRKEKARLEAKRAQEIQEAIDFQEDVSTKDKNWLKRYLEAQAAEAVAVASAAVHAETAIPETIEEAGAIAQENEVASEIVEESIVISDETLGGFDFEEDSIVSGEAVGASSTDMEGLIEDGEEIAETEDEVEMDIDLHAKPFDFDENPS